MKHEYHCHNLNCEDFSKVVIIDKPMSESSRYELCEKCTWDLKRIYSVTGIKTADGFKSGR